VTVRTRAAAAALLLAVAACQERRAPPAPAAHPDLAAHSAEFVRGVVDVTDGVHVAIGYGLANSILIEGRDGVIIVDTMESAEAARPVKAAFDAITSKPVKAIIYTHNHADHVFGAAVLAGDDHPDVWAHASTLALIDRLLNELRPIVYRRSMRQFGTFLPPGGVINDGIGPRLVIDRTTTPALLRPTKTFAGERTEIEVAGIRLVLVHAPGETPDQIFVWLPDRRVLLCGDNFYKSFPNLYAIRGTPYRDVMDWVHSLDVMRALGAEYLVPSHTRPITGANEILVALTDYRDAIQLVHDQTIRAMNAGLTPDEIVARVRLPPRLAAKPYLQEYYGRVDWAVRAIFDGELGWFGGNATDLAPLAPAAHAERMAALAGGKAALAARARDAAAAGDHQWALELADQALVLDPASTAARQVRAASLRALGAAAVNANARNYYLTQALETEDAVDLSPPPPSQAPPAMLASVPIRSVMHALPVHLDAEKAADVDLKAGFRFVDVGEAYTVHVRGGVAEVIDEFPTEPELTVTTTAAVWKDVVAGRRGAIAAIALGALKIEGGRLAFKRFMGLFQPG
jgi:alkyl sulfatase BDS1-like metallo-beta-lactamase superfamily hydrolase